MNQSDNSRETKTLPTAPFSMRLTPEEREFLDANCEGRPWAAYIRACVFGERSNLLRKRRPRIDDKELVEALSGLGQSRLSSNLNQLAKSANTGVLDLSPQTKQQLQDALSAVLLMRHSLISALGLEPTD